MSACEPQNPLIIQSDHSVLVELASHRYEAARNELVRFAELVKSPEHIHTYCITPLSIWNAFAAGFQQASILKSLCRYAKCPVPENVLTSIENFAARYGRLRLEKNETGLTLTIDDDVLAEGIFHNPKIKRFFTSRVSGKVFRVHSADRGKIKQALIKIGYPAEDLAGYTPGESLAFGLRSIALSGNPFQLRDYQGRAAAGYMQTARPGAVPA